MYSAVCEVCKNQHHNNDEIEEKNKYTYIGETSRNFRTRVKEHMNSLKQYNPKSFQLQHWHEKHKDDLHCPSFKFKVIGQFRDALTRQLAITILDCGGLYKKSEFRINEIYRL